MRPSLMPLDVLVFKWCSHNFQGQIIAALSQKIPLIQSVELVEAMTARRAMLFAKELSLFDVEIEGGLLKGSHCPEYAEEVWNFIWSCD